MTAPKQSQISSRDLHAEPGIEEEKEPAVLEKQPGPPHLQTGPPCRKGRGPGKAAGGGGSEATDWGQAGYRRCGCAQLPVVLELVCAEDQGLVG